MVYGLQSRDVEKPRTQPALLVRTFHLAQLSLMNRALSQKDHPSKQFSAEDQAADLRKQILVSCELTPSEGDKVEGEECRQQPVNLLRGE